MMIVLCDLINTVRDDEDFRFSVLKKIIFLFKKNYYTGNENLSVNENNSLLNFKFSRKSGSEELVLIHTRY